jgi:putative transposase
MCQALQVSRSGYYAYFSRSESNRSKANRELLETIKEIHKKSHGIYGAPQITKNLPENQKASKGRVARLMRANGIRSKVSKKYKATTYSNHSLPVADNILNRNLRPVDLTRSGYRILRIFLQKKVGFILLV